jgi:hypothetical protein
MINVQKRLPITPPFESRRPPLTHPSVKEQSENEHREIAAYHILDR